MLVVSLVLVALALATVKILDRQVIEAAAERNRYAEFLLAASVVSRGIKNSEDLRDSQRMNILLSDIQQLRPGIRELEIVVFASGTAKAVLRTGNNQVMEDLNDSEIQALRSSKVLSYFKSFGEERAWVFTVPIASKDTIVGALRGRFSVSKYDELIDAQEQVAKQVAIGSVIVTALTMLLLIRIQLHRPLSRLLAAMEQVRAGNLSLEAPVDGPLEIRRLAEAFDQMMQRLQNIMNEKENLLKEIRDWNEKLETRVAEAVEELENERDKVASAQLESQRNSKLAALGEMSAIMAHELGNPLNILSGRVQLMNCTAMPDECVRHLDAIRGQVTRMSNVMKNILNSTSIAQVASAVYLNDVIVEAIALVHAPHINLVTDLAADLPPIAVDKTSLQGVILNLITNAVQAMNDSGDLRMVTCLAVKPEIEGHLLVQSMSDARPTVRLMVEDSGPGIPPNLVDRICEPFFSTRRTEGGTGLGLAICKRVISRAGGQFAVKSSPGRHTVFIVDFPLWVTSAKHGG